MTETFFKEKIKNLHFGQGVPYTEIGRRIGVTGQYISLIMKGNKPITKSLLEKAELCDLFSETSAVLIEKKYYDFIESLATEELRAQSALILLREKFKGQEE